MPRKRFLGGVSAAVAVALYWVSPSRAAAPLSHRLPSSQALAAGHEVVDADARRLAGVGIALAALAALLFVGLAAYFRHLRLATGSRPSDVPASLIGQRAPLPPVPRLQSDNSKELLGARAGWGALLGGYGWTGRDRSTARIPIDRAMDLYAHRAAGRGPSSSPLEILRQASIEQRPGADLPAKAEFRDESGQIKALGGYFTGRKPLILALAYYRCPNLCTQVLNNLVESLRRLPERLGSDYDVLTISIDPREQPALALAKKRSYLARYGWAVGSDAARAPWHFLTGPEASIRTVADRIGFHYAYDPATRQFAHASGILVLTPSGRVSQYLLGVTYEPSALSRALHRASLGRIGRIVDQILLTCFHYDPALSPNGPRIELVLRIAAGASVAALAAFLLLLSRPSSSRKKGGTT